jgi:hypothetical protein
MNLTLSGMKIDSSAEQYPNASLSMRVTLKWRSNVTVERELQLKKQHEQIRSTDAGIQIDLSDEQCENAELPVRISLEFDSNVTMEREVQR